MRQLLVLRAPGDATFTPTFQVTNFYDTVLATLALDGPAGPEDNEAQSGLSLFSLAGEHHLPWHARPGHQSRSGVARGRGGARLRQPPGSCDERGYSFALSLPTVAAELAALVYVDGTWPLFRTTPAPRGQGFKSLQHRLHAGERGGLRIQPANEFPDGGDECPVGSFTPGIAQFTGQFRWFPGS